MIDYRYKLRIHFSDIREADYTENSIEIYHMISKRRAAERYIRVLDFEIFHISMVYCDGSREDSRSGFTTGMVLGMVCGMGDGAGVT